MAWTDEMVKKLKELWHQGITTGEIGRRLGISKNSIVGKVHRLGLEGRPSPIKKADSPIKEKKTASKKEKKPAASKTSKVADKVVATPTENKADKADKKANTSVSEKKPAPKAKTASVVFSTPLPDEEDIKLAKSLTIQEDKDCEKENISLTELDNHTCRWPIGDPKDDDFHFCGHKVKTGQTYCDEHAAIAYVKPARH